MGRGKAAGRWCALAWTAAVWLNLAGVAAAGFTSAPSSPSMVVSTGTLAAPPSLNAVPGVCVPLVSRNVDLSWTVTSSAFADGYEILRATVSGGPYSSIATVGSLQTTYINTGVAASTTYYYVVRATKLLWRSANSPQASVTTPNSLCA